MPEQIDVASADAVETGHEDHHHVEFSVEAESLNVKLIGGIVLGTVIVVLGLILVGFTITEVTSRELVAESIAQTTYPELREARAAATARLMKYEVVDAANGVYRMPIDRAIDLMVNEQFQNKDEMSYSSELQLLPDQ